MTRIDYLVSWRECFAAVAAPRLPASIRRPLLAIVAAVALVGLLWAVEELRLRDAQQDGARFAARAAGAATAAGRVRAVAREVERLRGLTGRIDAMRASGSRDADNIAAIGNGIPSDAWLSNLRVDRGAYTIDGRTTRLATVSATMSALAALPPFAGARLLAVRRNAGRDDVTYTIALEPRQ